MADNTHFNRLMGEATRHLVADVESASRAYDRHTTKPQPVRVIVRVPFLLSGQPTTVGETVTLPDYEADAQCALGRAARV